MPCWKWPEQGHHCSEHYTWEWLGNGGHIKVNTQNNRASSILVFPTENTQKAALVLGILLKAWSMKELQPAFLCLAIMIGGQLLSPGMGNIPGISKYSRVVLKTQMAFEAKIGNFCFKLTICNLFSFNMYLYISPLV